MNITEINEIHGLDTVGGLDVIINVSLTLFLNTLLLLIFAYLHSVSLAKQCVLLDLYKEFLIVHTLCISLINALPITICTYGYPMNLIPATIVTFCLAIGTIVLLLLANVIHLLKYRMNKEKMLDPPMPWGEDEQKGLMWIRVFCWGFSIGFVVTTYVFGMQPVYYHLLIGQDYDDMSFIHPSISTLLLVTCGLFVVGESYCQKNNDGRAFDPVVTRRLKYLALSIAFVAVLAAIGNIFIETPIPRGQFKIWIRRKSLTFKIVLIVEIMITLGTILKADLVKSYVFKLLNNVYDHAFFLNIYLVPLLLFTLIHGCLFIVYRLFDI